MWLAACLSRLISALIKAVDSVGKLLAEHLGIGVTVVVAKT
jgi:hypothetical protein